MASFMMAALTLDREWYPFKLADIPTTFNDAEFVLFNRPETPRLLLKGIRRGDVESGLFEGDIIRADGTDWVVCYQRGFYAINGEYVIRYLYQFDNYEFLGTHPRITVPVPINFKSKYLFMYNGTVFRLNDIIGGYKGRLILRTCSEPVDVDDVNQECCIVYRGRKVYLSDIIDGEPITLKGGRLTHKENGKIIDIATGGELVGYNPRTDNG